MEAEGADGALAFLVARIVEYPQYGDEAARRHCDMLVRSYVGERLALARERFSNELAPALATALDELILHCQFSDQVFVRHLEHGELSPEVHAHLLAADRRLVGRADEIEATTAETFDELVRSIDASFLARRALVVK